LPWHTTGIDKYGGYKGLKNKGEGFFKIFKSADGKFWFLTPDSNAFYSVGLNYINWDGFFCPKIGYSPYNKTCMQKYKTQERWVDETFKRIKQWGFNTIGAWSSESLYSKGMPYTILLHLLHIAGADWLEKYFPDIYSNYTREIINQYAKNVCSKYRDDPYLIGYFSDNEIFWQADWRGKRSIFDTYMSFEPEDAGKLTLVKFLERRYSNIHELKSVWSVKASSFSNLLEVKKMTPKNILQANKDKNEFLGMVAYKYYSLVSEAIKTHDPNHLYLGSRFAFGVQRPVLEAASKYCDVISINFYWCTWFEIFVELYHLWCKNVSALNWLGKYHKITKKPLLITEFSYRAKDSSLPNKIGAGVVVANQEQRGIYYTNFVKRCLQKDYIIGYHWYCYYDEPHKGRAYDYEDGNYGLVDNNDRPYEKLCSFVTRINHKVYNLRLSTK
jgi:agarase